MVGARPATFLQKLEPTLGFEVGSFVHLFAGNGITSTNGFPALTAELGVQKGSVK